MARVYSVAVSGDRRKQILSFIKRRLSELRETVDAAQEESDMLQALMRAMNPCRHCAGQGKVVMHVAQDETVDQPCSFCHGSGRGHQSVNDVGLGPL